MQYSTSAKQLESLLQIDFNLQTKENISQYDEIAGEFANSIILVGVGEIGKKALAGLKKIGINPLSFADNNKTLWGKTVGGLIVLSPMDAARKFEELKSSIDELQPEVQFYIDGMERLLKRLKLKAKQLANTISDDKSGSAEVVLNKIKETLWQSHRKN